MPRRIGVALANTSPMPYISVFCKDLHLQIRKPCMLGDVCLLWPSPWLRASKLLGSFLTPCHCPLQTLLLIIPSSWAFLCVFKSCPSKWCHFKECFSFYEVNHLPRLVGKKPKRGWVIAASHVAIGGRFLLETFPYPDTETILLFIWCRVSNAVNSEIPISFLNHTLSLDFMWTTKAFFLVTGFFNLQILGWPDQELTVSLQFWSPLQIQNHISFNPSPPVNTGISGKWQDLVFKQKHIKEHK